MIRPEDAGDKTRADHPTFDHSEPCGEAHLAALMRELDIPIVTAQPSSDGIWADLHLSDCVSLAAWSRPFRNTDEMKPSPAARVEPASTGGRHHARASPEDRELVEETK